VETPVSGDRGGQRHLAAEVLQLEPQAGHDLTLEDVQFIGRGERGADATKVPVSNGLDAVLLVQRGLAGREGGRRLITGGDVPAGPAAAHSSPCSPSSTT